MPYLAKRSVNLRSVCGEIGRAVDDKAQRREIEPSEVRVVDADWRKLEREFVRRKTSRGTCASPQPRGGRTRKAIADIT